MLDALLHRYGTPVEFAGKVLYTFWTPGRLAPGVPEDELRSLKVGYRAKILLRQAQELQESSFADEQLRALDSIELRTRLLALYGVGPASVGILQFELYHDYDAICHISPWEQQIYSQLLFSKPRVSVPRILKRIAPWRPWRMLAMGDALERIGQLAEAENGYEQAVLVNARLTRDFPDNPVFKKSLAKIYHNLGNLLVEKGQSDSALAHFGNALEIQEKLVSGFEDNNYRFELYFTYTALGTLSYRDGNHGKAAAFYKKALAVQTEPTPLPLEDRAYRHIRACTQINLANVLSDLNSQDRKVLYDQAIVILAELVNQYPDTWYCVSFAGALENRSNLMRSKKLLKQADTDVRRALELRKRLASDFPKIPSYGSDLGRTLHALALVEVEKGNIAEMWQCLEEAINCQQKAHKISPHNGRYRLLFVNYLGAYAGLKIASRF